MALTLHDWIHNNLHPINISTRLVQIYLRLTDGPASVRERRVRASALYTLEHIYPNLRDLIEDPDEINHLVDMYVEPKGERAAFERILTLLKRREAEEKREALNAIAGQRSSGEVVRRAM